MFRKPKSPSPSKRDLPTPSSPRSPQSFYSPASSPKGATHLDVPTPVLQRFPDSPPSPVPRERSPSLSRVDPFARVFPLPPQDGSNLQPTIRPGSVRSVTLERQEAGEDAVSIRSRKGSIKSLHRSSPRPPLPTQAELAMMPSLDMSNGVGPSMSPRVLSDDSASEAADRLGALTSPNDSMGVIGSFDKRLNHSVMSLGAKVKAQKVLGVDPQPRFASLYLVSGLGKVGGTQALFIVLTSQRTPHNGR